MMGAGADRGEFRERTAGGVIAAFTWKLARTPTLRGLLGAARVVWRPRDGGAERVDAVVGWGRKANTAAALRYARRHGLPYWRVEDGLLRSVGLGVDGDPPLSIVVDDRGIYYDATTRSRLEALLDGADGGPDPLVDAALLARAERCMARIRSARLSKYNVSPPGPVRLGAAPAGGRVLVVDQTFGDLSVAGGLAEARCYHDMLAAALAEHPRAEVLVKVHPDVVAGKRKGYLGRVAGRPRVRVIAEPVNPIGLLEQVDHVYVVTSQMGMEALIVGKPVTCFGAPFYAGWGLTDDRRAVPRRGRSRTLAELFAAAYILYARYVDPDTGQPCEIERVIEHLALQRRIFERNGGRIFCFGFRLWKRNYVRAYLRCPGNRVVFARDAAHAERLGFDRNARIVVWGQRGRDAARVLATRHGVGVWCMEDGFLRSVGLGSDLVTPASLVVDREGIYYDPTGPSELESIIEAGELSDDELARARELRRRIVEAGLSKYNLGQRRRIMTPAGKRVILVPGQVEDDASIRLGCRDTRTNLELLREVRRGNPDAFIVYKPHPDVLSGNRLGAIARSEALASCDHVESDASLVDCLAVADEVHTLTSLVGFEALLRGLAVTVYGQPFYAGWGLTTDRHPVARRGRRVSLDELVGCALIRYPRYLNRETYRFTTPEAVIDQLRRERDAGSGGHQLLVSWPRRQLRKAIHVYKGVTHAP